MRAAMTDILVLTFNEKAKIDEAGTLISAQMSLSKSVYDLIICDLNLTQKNHAEEGITIYRISAELIDPPKFIFCTGNPEALNQKWVMDSGIPVVSKPFGIKHIKEAIESFSMQNRPSARSRKIAG